MAAPVTEASIWRTTDAGARSIAEVGLQADQAVAWAIGILDEVWGSRFALPSVHAWQRPDEPVRLIEQNWQKGDPARVRTLGAAR
jgi:hypothetical protein